MLGKTGKTSFAGIRNWLKVVNFTPYETTVTQAGDYSNAYS